MKGNDGTCADIAIVGAGAAGLMAAIWAGRTAPDRRIILLDSAKRIGAKILVAGGGRCNVTHHEVDESAYAGSTKPAIRNVLRRFDVPQTVAFFREIGVTLKREDTGKLFPTTDRARTVLDALLNAARKSGVELIHPWRVQSVSREDEAGPFTIHREGVDESISARSVILATGGKALPKSGSDGHGYEIAKSLGHTVTARVFPALVPLTLPEGHFLCTLSGITLPATLELRSATGKRLQSFTNSTLFTHFGVSGPSVLDISRYVLDAQMDDPNATLVINLLPGMTFEQVLALLNTATGGNMFKVLSQRLPDRVARTVLQQAGVPPGTPTAHIGRELKRAIAHMLVELPLPIVGHRGFARAEATAGGVPLSEIHLRTMESRVQPGLYLCGELCDVDGRIGGFNFQWAWSSGYVAGISAAAH